MNFLHALLMYVTTSRYSFDHALELWVPVTTFDAANEQLRLQAVLSMVNLAKTAIAPQIMYANFNNWPVHKTFVADGDNISKGWHLSGEPFSHAFDVGSTIPAIRSW